jgi:CheY-like chemotaxis protein
MLPYSELGMPREPVSLPQDFKVLVGMPSVHCSRITEHLDRWAVPYEYFSHPEALSAAVRAALGKLVVITQADWSGPDDGWLEAGRAVLYYPILPGPTMDESHLHSDAIRLQFPIRPSQLRSALLAAVAPSGNVQSSPKISVEKRTRRGKVLLVEDNVVNQKVARRLLERCGCEVAVAEDGQDALDKLDLDAYDLVLMDCHMPRLDGYQATHVIREKKQDWSRVPIVALTASVMEDDRRRCLNAGMNDFLPKPLELDALQAVLERWLPGPE